MIFLDHIQNIRQRRKRVREHDMAKLGHRMDEIIDFIGRRRAIGCCVCVSRSHDSDKFGGKETPRVPTYNSTKKINPFSKDKNILCPKAADRWPIMKLFDPISEAPAARYDRYDGRDVELVPLGRY